MIGSMLEGLCGFSVGGVLSGDHDAVPGVALHVNGASQGLVTCDVL